MAAESKSDGGGGLISWFDDRVQRALERTVEDFVAKAILLSLASATGAGIALSVLLWHSIHLGFEWKVVAVAAFAVLLASLLSATIGVVRLASRTRRLQLFDVSELEDQLAQTSYGVEFLSNVVLGLQEMLAADDVGILDVLDRSADPLDPECPAALGSPPSDSSRRWRAPVARK